MNQKNLLFDIKRFSINDGPGIRISIYFKGCPLHCIWCHNPESQASEKQKLYSISKCINCHNCISYCPENAIHADPKQGIITDFTLCKSCNTCALHCPSHAIAICGYEKSIEDIMQEIKRETLTLDTSGGGVTFSGGEPLQHPDILIPLLTACAAEGIHSAVDTSGFADKHTLLEVARHTDLFLYDLKHMDSAIHKKLTGVPNEIILSNLYTLAENNSNIIIRMPLIEGINTDDTNIEASALFIKSLPGKKIPVNLLTYHAIAIHKFKKLGIENNTVEMATPSTEKLNNCINLFTKHNITATVG